MFLGVFIEYACERSLVMVVSPATVLSWLVVAMVVAKL